MLRAHMALLWSAKSNWFRSYKYVAALRPKPLSNNTQLTHCGRVSRLARNPYLVRGYCFDAGRQQELLRGFGEKREPFVAD